MRILDWRCYKRIYSLFQLEDDLRILTFNHHENYIANLAKIGDSIDVVTRYKNHDLRWNEKSVAIPENVRLVNFSDIQKDLKDGSYSVVICHTILTLLWMFPYFNNRFIFIAHIVLFRQSWKQRFYSAIKKVVYVFFSILHPTEFVAISPLRLKSWAVARHARVIAHPVPEKFIGRHIKSHENRVLVVCNDIASRKEELGWSLIQQIAAEGVPLKIVGHNPGIEENLGVEPKDREEFEREFLKGGVYLYTIQKEYGDGFNMALLEAMSVGMPVVTIQNPSSPIQHGVNGFVGHRRQQLIHCIEKLLKNPNMMHTLGLNAQKTVFEDFSPEQFVSHWRKVVRDAGQRPLLMIDTLFSKERSL